MADLIIRGMDIPKENDILVFDVWHGKVYARSTANTGTRHYEVVSIQEGHGRLIDADALLLDAGEVCEVCGDGFTISGFSREQIENAPTIIDADLEWKMRNCCCFSNDQKEGGLTMATDKLVDFDHVTDYISREAALSCFHDWIDRYGHEHSADEMTEYQRIEELPAADVRPVVRGKWIMNSDRPDTLICTACDHAFDVWVWDHKWMHFCPNCGADMREVASGDTGTKG